MLRKFIPPYRLLYIIVVLFVMLPIASCADVPIDAAHFPDPVLRKWLQELPWFDGWKQVPIIYEGKVTGYRWEWSEAYKDGVLNDYELNHKDFLGPSDSDLADLSGIQYLTNLKRVYCTNVKVITANISGFSKLIEFHLSGSNLESINASGCSSLKVLGFADSPNIKYVNLNGCSALETIYCTNTPPAIEGLTSCRNLKLFAGGNNRFASISFSGLSALEYICADGPSLTKVNVNGCISLKELWTGSKEKKLKKLDLSSCGNLVKLGCLDSGLEELDLSQNPKLEELHCENNRLTELDLSGNAFLGIAYCGGQKADGLKVKAINGGYEVCLKDYVSKIENIDISSIRANKGSAKLLSYNGETGIVIFDECPSELFYVYRTHSPNNDLMDVTIKSSMTVDVIERGGPTDNIIYDINEKNYLDASGNALDEDSISHLSAKKYGKKGFVADGNSRLIVRVQTQRPGNVTFSLKENIGVEIERLSDRAKTNSFHTTEIGGNNYQASVVLVAPEMFPSGRFPSADFTVNVKFTADETGEDIPEDEKQAEANIELEIHAAPVVLIPSFGINNGDSFSNNSGEGILPALKNFGFDVRQYSYSGTMSSSNTAVHITLFNELAQLFSDYVANGIVCTKTDFVGYGIGGLIARHFCLPTVKQPDRNYYTFRSYGKGMVRRIVTIATPHRGTLWADYMNANFAPVASNSENTLYTKLAYTLLVAGWPVLKPLIENSCFPGVAPDIWSDMSVESPSVGSFPENVPMYSIYGRASATINNIMSVLDTVKATLETLMIVTSFYKTASKYLDLYRDAHYSSEIKNTMEELKGNNVNAFDVLGKLAEKDGKNLTAALEEIKNIIMDEFKSRIRSAGIDFLDSAYSGGLGVHPVITWIFKTAPQLAAQTALIYPQLVSGPGGWIALAFDIIKAIPYIIFGNSDYDCFVSENSARTDFGNASLGFDGWQYRHTAICQNQDIGLHVVGLLKSNKSMFKTFTTSYQYTPAVLKSMNVMTSNEHDIASIDIDPDKLYLTHFELAAFPDTLSVKDSGKVRITAISDTDIEETVYLVLQKGGYDSILPLISTDINKFEISIEFTSRDFGTMSIYCFTKGSDSVYISNMAELNIKADLSDERLESISFLGNTSGVLFTSANSDISAGLYAKTSDGSTFDISSPLMGTVWTSDNPSVAIVSEDGLIHSLADGTATLTATYAGLTASIIVNVGEITSPEILTDNLNDGFAGRNYSTELKSSGTPLISWRIVDGRLPDELTLSDTGIISGIPSSEGTFTFTVEASNISGSSSREFTLKIGSAGEAALPVDANNFPDDNFRNYIAQNFDLDNDGRLNDLEISGIKIVSVPGMGINSLKGIEYFTAIEYLTCSNNNIAEIDLSHSPNFIGLACQDNQIESLNLTNCSKLSQIWFGSNKLTEIDFSGNPELSIIGGHNNMLAQLDVSVCEKLTELHCGENQLETLRLGNKPALLKLYCYSNKLKNLDIGRCTALQELHFGGNNVKEIDLTKNNELVMLHCWQNPLTVLNLSSCPKLTDLNCDESVKIVRTISISGTLSTGIKYAAYTGTLKVSGGVSPYTWRISSGALPDGLTIDESTGKITGTPTKAGTFTFKVKVTDKNSTSKTKSYTVKITKPSISGTLSNGIKYASYTGTLKASNGTSPYTWSISAGALPDGLTIGESTGKISGTPTKAGTFKFTVKFTDKNNSAATKSYTIKITKPSISGTLSNGIKYASYSKTLKASNGTSPYTWTISEGTLPNGLMLNKSTGKISGTPTKAGTFKFTVKVTDKNNSTATKEYTVKITKPSISGTLSNGIKYASYTGTLKASNGTSPYTWSISSGTLPDGLTIGESNGKISGTPTKAGTFKFTVKVTDKNNSATTKEYTVKITKPSISGSLSAGTVGKSYSKTLKATGGTTSYTWTKASGSLPSGVKLGKTTGKISGTPTKAGKFTFKIKVTDANGAAAEKSFTVTIKAASSSSANEYTEEYETLRYSEDENESPEDILTVTLTPDEDINVKAEHDTHSYYVTGLSVMSDDVLSHGTDRDDDIVIVRANQPVKFIIGTWPHEVSDECVYVDDEPAEEIEIAEGRFTLPSEMIHDDFKICVKAQAGDSELESQEIYISAE